MSKHVSRDWLLITHWTLQALCPSYAFFLSQFIYWNFVYNSSSNVWSVTSLEFWQLWEGVRICFQNLIKEVLESLQSYLCFTKFMNICIYVDILNLDINQDVHFPSFLGSQVTHANKLTKVIKVVLSQSCCLVIREQIVVNKYIFYFPGFFCNYLKLLLFYVLE